MKIYISADIERISGVVNRSHTSTKGNNYERARELMTNEVNVSIEGAIKAGSILEAYRARMVMTVLASEV
jgi:D-amino peptidase